MLKPESRSLGSEPFRGRKAEADFVTKLQGGLSERHRKLNGLRRVQAVAEIEPIVRRR